MKTLDIGTTILLLAAALNIGLIGFFGFNLVTVLFGEAGVIARIIYGVVGLAALYAIGSFTFGRKETEHRWCETLSAVHH